MKTIIRTLSLPLLMSGCVLFNSCSKSVDVKSTADIITPQVQQAAQLDAVNGSFDADNFDNDINDIVMSDNTDVQNSFTSGAQSGIHQQPTRTYSPSQNVYPHTLTVDYGTGFTTIFGVVKTGKVVSYFSAPLAQTGASVVTTFVNYTSSGNTVTGTNTIKNITGKKDVCLVFNHLSERTLLYANGDSRKLVTDKVYFMVSAPNLPGVTVNNKENYIAGSTVGTDVVGGINSYWIATVDPLNLMHKMNTCQFADKGIVGALVYPLSSKTPIIEALNYGDGTCDDSAVLTYKGSSEVVELPLNVWPIK